MCFVLHSLCIRLSCNCAKSGGYVDVKLEKCTMDISKGLCVLDPFLCFSQNFEPKKVHNMLCVMLDL